MREFQNPIYYTRDRWLQYHLSMEGVPQESDAKHEAYFAELNEIFNRGNEICYSCSVGI